MNNQGLSGSNRGEPLPVVIGADTTGLAFTNRAEPIWFIATGTTGGGAPPTEAARVQVIWIGV